jgi:DNA-binding NtrC family response regulator
VRDVASERYGYTIFSENLVMQVARLNNQAFAPISFSASADYPSELTGQSIIGISKWTQTAQMLAEIHAVHDNAVILEGEHGTGKKFLARLIHQSSSRRHRLFVSLMLGSTTDELARSVLFGDDDERRTGIESGEKGLAKLAQGGTLYIEVGSSLSPSLRDNIIQLAGHHRMNPEGDGNVRILLGRVVAAGLGSTAPADLDYERIQIPPLRERPEDIEALAAHFIRVRCEQSGKELRRLSPEAVRALRGYDWPRNVSELRTLVQQLVNQVSPPSIEVGLLPAYVAGPYRAQSLIPAAGLDLDNEVKRIEVDLICAALKQSRGLQNRAARLLRIKPTTLFMKIRRHGIDVDAFR